MATNDNSPSVSAGDDWGVVLQSVPSKSKKNTLKLLHEVFRLDKNDAEQVMANMPLILLDNIPFSVASRVKKHFQSMGTVVETTNHDMIKKNCFQIVWPEMPDLSFFLQEAKVSSGVTAHDKKEGKKQEHPEKKEGSPKSYEPFSSDSPAPAVQGHEPSTLPVPAPAASQPAGGDSDWQRRADELNEKLRKIQDEKQRQIEQHAEIAEKVKHEFQQKLDEEKQKSQEIAKAYEDLQKEAQKQEALTRDGEEWRSKAMALGEKVRELEMLLLQKSSAIEHLVQQKDEISKQAEKVAELGALLTDFERNAAASASENAGQRERLAELEKALAESQRLLSEAQDREQGLGRRTGELESALNDAHRSFSEIEGRERELGRRIGELEGGLSAKENERAIAQNRIGELEQALSRTEQELSSIRGRESELLQKVSDHELHANALNESLRSRDGMLAQFEKQLLELAEKVRESETMRQEHAQLVQERALIRQEYDAKAAEQEVRLANIEEENRRYRSRTDRKSAAATRELGELVRSVDTLRQGLQKLILFLGSESAVLEQEKKGLRKSPLTRGPDAPNPKQG